MWLLEPTVLAFIGTVCGVVIAASVVVTSVVLARRLAPLSSSAPLTGEALVAKADIVVSGVSVGLPGSKVDVFSESNWEALVHGECRIEPIEARGVEALLARNVVQIKKDGEALKKVRVREASQTVAVSARLGSLDLDKYGVPKALAKTMGRATQVAVAAGLEALRDAELLDEAWRLRDEYQDSTGVIYATSFPALDAAVGEVSRFATDEDYAFDRKFLFKVLVLANAQLAQLVGARGPNLQTNAACAGTTQAIGLACDLIRANRCDRVVVVSGDDASGETLMPWLGNGFNALGAASIAPTVDLAVRPFDQRRNGMILGAAACGVVVGRKRGEAARPRCRVLETRFVNSAYHGAAMDKHHIAREMEFFVASVEKRHQISRATLAKHGMYLSHETGTHATPSSSCAANEVHALKLVFGDHLKHLVVINTKAITGHPMAVGVEDALAAFALSNPECRLPPLPPDTVPDPNLQATLKLPLKDVDIHRRDLRFALRFAAGFGSHVAFALYAAIDA
ncbi:hypothetical protein CTAYLR_006303 [Chrysophaeum taylorii]|uniref:beta-ketoacyl-[acyl-carrier-protein] synthase I n=1 Tax=Chrysophaeum taylorii TaxID=2483200 RepID=A0AAD7UA02_9STRA|nr:hypothetical protein CTAYLR_006303 [Chrysophaeum taylorii]